jgi:hypothetical protein
MSPKGGGTNNEIMNIMYKIRMNDYNREKNEYMKKKNREMERIRS